MPATSVRDLIVKDNDLAVATHGRGFWILDNMTSLRQINNKIAEHNFLFKPATTTRVRWDNNTDTPLPPDEPAGQNPPDGAIIDYNLNGKANGEVTLEIIDAKGNVVRHYSSNDTLYKIPAVDIPLYWIRPQQILSGEAGSHRFIWDLHYTPLNLPASYPIAAVYKNTAPESTSPWVMPGNYTVRLKVNNETFSQPLIIKMDPRVKTSAAELKKQYDLSMVCYEGRLKISKISNETVSIHNQIKELLSKSKDDLHASLSSLDEKIINIENAKTKDKSKAFSQVSNSFASLFGILQESDMPPTKRTIESVGELNKNFQQLEEVWMKIKKSDIPSVNRELKKAGLPGY